MSAQRSDASPLANGHANTITEASRHNGRITWQQTDMPNRELVGDLQDTYLRLHHLCWMHIHPMRLCCIAALSLQSPSQSGDFITVQVPGTWMDKRVHSPCHHGRRLTGHGNYIIHINQTHQQCDQRVTTAFSAFPTNGCIFYMFSMRFWATFVATGHCLFNLDIFMVFSRISTCNYLF